jgi:hypothetical protein
MRNFRQNMFLYCGLAVNNLVHNRFITRPTFAHIPHNLVVKNLYRLLYTFLTQFNHPFLHTFFTQFISVKGVLFTQSTGTTITTTYNK